MQRSKGSGLLELMVVRVVAAMRVGAVGSAEVRRNDFVRVANGAVDRPGGSTR